MRVGLTGGIASGKSTASDELRRLGVPVIDYDRLAYDAIAPGTPGEAAVASAFGSPVLDDASHIDRSALAKEAFASADKRLLLESIVHPLVYQAAAGLEAAAQAEGHDVIMHEIPLLTEVVDPNIFDQIVVVEAPVDERIRRLVVARGMNRDLAMARIRAQATDEQRRAIADVVWDGSGSADELRVQVRAWVSQMITH